MAATLKLDTIQNASSATANLTLDANGNATVGNTLVMGSSFLRNRIINGDMRIDQRNAGAAVTTSGSYAVDRWYFNNATDATLSFQQSTDVPSGQGFVNSVKITTTVADASIGAAQYANIQHKIEGYNAADFGFGASGAQSVTLSFWVKATQTGQYSVAFYNSAENRINPQSFSVSASNTWEKKTIAISGDTSGTWLTTNGIGLNVTFYYALGSNFLGASGWNNGGTYGVTGQSNAIGTNTNVFAITGVQLEVGSVATPFERRQYGQELALCQRYLPAYNAGGSTSALIAPGFEYSTTNAAATVTFPVTARVAPTGITVSNATHFNFNDTAAHAASAITLGGLTSPSACQVTVTSTGFTNGYGGQLFFNNGSGQLLFTGCEL